ncbi:MAG TPA: hypothetical protein VKA49_02680 [Flavitalea sp.]|nr:hypothetical protein [Flavitalea sp.]
MKMIKLLGLLVAMSISLGISAQRIKLVEGDLSVLNSEQNINTEFTYDNMKVGKYEKEADYVSDKTASLNKKEPGRGDTWAKAWVSDRKERFEPKFNELFAQSSKMNTSKDAKYTLIFKTVTTEPGFNIGITRKNAEINAEVLVVETANRNKVVAKATVQKAVGRTFGGFDFDTGERLSEAYADAGKGLGKFIKSK